MGQKNMCEGDPIGVDVLVTIMGPPEKKKIINMLLNVIFIQTVQREQCVNILCEYKLDLTT